MKRLLVWLVLLGVLGLALYKGGVWWLADQRLAHWRTALQSEGVLDRGRLGSGLDGHLTLTNPQWQDFRLTEPLTAGRVRFSAGSPQALVTFLLEGRLPASWTLQAEQLGLVLDANLLKDWVTAPPRSGEVPVPPLLQLPCGPDPRQQLGGGDLLRMGVTSLAGEAQVQQDGSGLRGELNTDGTGSLEFDWPGARLAPLAWPDWPVDAGAAPLTVTVRDAGLMRRVSAYCARARQSSVEDWVARAADALEEGLTARGWTASPALLSLYRRWLLEGGELSLELRPNQPLAGLAEGLSARYNGEPVAGVSVAEAEEPATAPAAGAPLAGTAAPAVTTDANAEGGRQWYAEPQDTASDWAGYRVRLTLTNGNLIEGRLVRITEDVFDVARVVAGGEVTYPIQRSAVQSVEVWRRPRTP
ncbi:acetylornithine deacetylase [Marinobacter sp. C2H3]|uniref:acetylornithine deacetylase n=1 Tax=Marinobacter sp. C2H3 TaxID=3119003 RepID=UPI00300E9B36